MNWPKKFATVDGFDFSEAFVKTAKKMQLEKKLTYSSLQFGETFEDRVVSLPESLNTEGINFFWGDACSLSANENVSKKGYDVVHASNLLCRLPKPKQFLKDCGEWVVKPGGLLVLVSPYSWLEDYTAKEDWVMGLEGPFEALKAELSEKFELVDRKPFPFLIREHARKFQYGVSDATVWKKKCT
uniref:Methyltransferase type 11 domain-containing protein n=1 Tax=Paramoeba aestuarina TaxID=180227 RepID=A0A7S4K6U6_9EUKA